VLAKPEDYGSRAIDLDVFLTVLAERIAEHNTRQNRRSPVAYNRSFAEVFDESYASAPIRKATEAQRRLWLLGAEGLRADTNNGSVWFQGNQFYDPWMLAIAGQRIIVRFDPADFLAGLHIYAQDGAYLGHARIKQAVGFFDQDEARLHAAATKRFRKAQREALDAQRTLTAAQMGRMLDEAAPAAEAPVEAKVVKPVFGKASPLRMEADARPQPVLDDAIASRQAAMIAELDAYRPAVTPEPESEEMALFRLALRVEALMAAGEPVTAEEARWLRGYQATATYRGQRGLYDEFGDAMFG
jgi:putative transposase